MYLVFGAISLRLLQILFGARGRGSEMQAQSVSLASVCLGLVLPFALAAATQQFHTHYFGLLILPVLEAALYLSLASTVFVATVASGSDLFWVAYAAHFRSPFQLGELLEAATLVLVIFIVGTLVWFLMERLALRDAELHDRLIDLQATRSQLVEGEKLAAIGRLASAVAHEIRNPVAIITSAIEATANLSFSPEDRAEMAQVAVAEARRLGHLTTDFLTYAQPGIAPQAEIDALALVGYITSVARAHALEKSARLVLQEAEECLVYGNIDQLQQALLNLVRNAIDASPTSGRIVVKLEKRSATVNISIQNEGPSIPAYAVDQIFEPFFTAKRGGTGLGLSIARKIAEAHRGRVRLEKNADDCVLFTLELPLHQPS